MDSYLICKKNKKNKKNLKNCLLFIGKNSKWNKITPVINRLEREETNIKLKYVYRTF